MRRWSSTAVLMMVVVVVSCIAAAYAGAADTRTARASATTLNVNVGQAAVTLDPSAAYDPSSLGLIQNVYVRLTQYGTKPGPNGTLVWDPQKVVPYLARSWTVSKDGKRYTFKLKPWEFDDGTPIDAAAVKYSLDRLLKEANTGAYVITNGIPGLYKSIQAPSSDTVVLNLRQPNADMVQDLAQSWASIVQPKVVEANGGVKAGALNKWMASHVAGGGGPYTLQSYNAGVGAVLQRNPVFAGPQVKSDTVRINYVGSDVTLALQARSGQADVTIGMSKQSAVNLKGVSGVRLIAAPTSGDQRVVMVRSHKPFDNKLVREALTYAIPYKDVLTRVNFGYGKLMYGPWAPTVPGFDTRLLKPRAYNPEKAKALLKRSGIKLPMSLKLAVQSDNTTEQQIATVVQSEWKPLGLNVEIVKLSAADMVTAAGKRTYPLLIQVNGPGVWSPLYSYGYDLTCGNAFNTSNTCNRAADALAKKASLETNPAKRRALLNQIVKLYHADSPLISLYNDVSLIVLGSKVKSFTASLYSLDVRNWG